MMRTRVRSERVLFILGWAFAGFSLCCGDSGLSHTIAPPGSPVILLSGSSATFSTVVGGTVPLPQSFSVTNTGGGTLGQLFTNATYPAGQPTGWLGASLSSRTAPSTIVLLAAVSGLPPQTLTAAMQVISPVATNSPQAISVTFTVAPCPATVALAVGQYTAIDPLATQGCVVFPTNSSVTDSAEYLLVPQAATEIPNGHTAFGLSSSAAAPVAPLLTAGALTPPSPALQFHDRLRELERTRAYGNGPAALAAPRRAIPATAPSDTVGNRRTFKVLSSLYALQLANVGAVARSVGQHIILYVDSMAPAGGLSTPDYDTMRSDFDTLLYAVDTAAFGRESDIDANGRVIVLMTNVVNQLVTAQQCFASGYVAGFFFGADIDPVVATQFNSGEIFYSMVADPGATLSCAHSNATVKRLLPVTFIHEFQHMISFNQHVRLRGGSAEVLWLNEGLSHYAEERGGRAFLQAGNTARFCDHVLGDLYSFGSYLMAPGGHALVDASGIGGLAERGAAWAFVRYLVDQFATDTDLAAADAFTRQLSLTSATGTANVAQHTGQSFATLAQRWVLTNWASDLPGFTAPPVLQYKHWAFRTAFPALNASCSSALPASFPLAAVASPGTGINLSGTMYAGSAGVYERALQGPSGGGFVVTFSDGSNGPLATAIVPRLNILRIR